MTPTQKMIAERMFRPGYYMAIRTNHHGRKMYMLYHSNAIIDGYVLPATFKFFDQLGVLKKDKNGKYTFNLSAVRQLHGKNSLKKMYKEKAS